MALLILIPLLASGSISAGQTVQRGKLTVEISGVNKGKGPVRVSLWRTADGFLKGRAYRHGSVDATADTVRINFEGLEPGQYAVNAFNDENNNGRLDTGFMGKPKEPFGFSNNARRTFGPPSFADAAFDMAAESKLIKFQLK